MYLQDWENYIYSCYIPVLLYLQDWEDYIYIDPQIFGHSVLWLLNYQREDGAFVETEHYQVSLHMSRS
jgi:hypothetical protein